MSSCTGINCMCVECAGPGIKIGDGPKESKPFKCPECPDCKLNSIHLFLMALKNQCKIEQSTVKGNLMCDWCNTKVTLFVSQSEFVPEPEILYEPSGKCEAVYKKEEE